MSWPELSFERDGETLAFLHLASQMIGKVKLANSYWVNHGWHIALQPVPDGLATLPIDAGGRRFSLTLDLCRHAILLGTDNGTIDQLAIDAGSVADLHKGLVGMLDRHGLPSRFHGAPNEIEAPVPFAKDDQPRPYSEESAARLRGALTHMLPIFDHHRAGFAGKSSPVHFFWGSFDLAVTRFSGRDAPQHPGGIPNLPDRITREAYSDEVASAGFWAVGAAEGEPFFYAYGYPTPDGLKDAAVAHGEWNDDLGEWVLPYEKVRCAENPAAMLKDFLDSAYNAVAKLADWDRERLERAPVAP